MSALDALPLPAEFLAFRPDCIHWNGALNWQGYGNMFRHDGKVSRAHRVAYARERLAELSGGAK